MEKTTNTGCKVYLVRHGETEWNRNGRWQGRQDVPLSDSGRAQAKSLALHFRNRREEISALYSSDLLRALETAQIIGQAIHQVPQAVPALREIHLGTWEGHTVAEIMQLDPANWARLEKGEDIARGGGETYGMFQARVMDWLNAAVAAHSGQTILIVTHGGCIRSILLHIRGLTWGERHQIPAVENTSVTQLCYSQAGWTVREESNTNHIHAEDTHVSSEVARDESKIV